MVIDAFMVISPRHRQALELLQAQKTRDHLGALGLGALRNEDDVFTLEQIAVPLLQRGLIEDLTKTELGPGGKYFCRITKLGEFCLGVGYMLKEPRPSSELEMRKLGLPKPDAHDIVIPAGATS